MIDPIEFLEQAHLRQAALCDALERIADGLPDDIDAELCASVVTELVVDMPRHHRDEEEGLFPLLEARARSDDNVAAHLALLRFEHATDESYAEELNDVLTALSVGQRPENPDMIGYMLRGFFESYRRHLKWENLVLLPLARERLTGADLTTLTDVIRAHREDMPAVIAH